MSKVILMFALASLLIYSCNSHKQKNKQEDDVQLNERWIKYRKDTTLNAEVSKENFNKHLANLMEIPDISQTKNAKYYRLWFWQSEQKFIVDISSNDAMNTCSVLSWNSKWKDSVEYIVINRKWENINPTTGWASLLNALNDNHIEELRGSNVDNYKQRLTLMSYIQFEIVNKEGYRFYEYLEPSYYRMVDKGAMDAYNFLKYLDSTLGIDIYSPPDSVYANP